MSLDLDGVLHVTAIEKETGNSKHVTIRDAFAQKSPEQIPAARKRLEALYASRLEEAEAAEEADQEGETGVEAPPELPGRAEAEKLLQRSRRLFGRLHPEDVEEAVGLHERIAAAIAAGDAAKLEQSTTALRELLFFLEGR